MSSDVRMDADRTGPCFRGVAQVVVDAANVAGERDAAHGVHSAAARPSVPAAVAALSGG
jgi:hypothetical protein